MGKTNIVLILLVMIPILISSSIGGTNTSIKDPVTYKVFVDQSKGFYRVYNEISGKAILPYKDRTLNINRGDTIVWENYASSDRRIIVVSKQGLWDNNNGTLPWNYRQFGYTFNKSGIYEVYVKEYPKLQQKIIVGPLETNLSTNKTVKTNTTKTNTTVNSTVDISKAKSNFTNSTPVVKINSTESVAESSMKSGFEVLAFIAAISLFVYVYDRKMK